jgi:lysophospholipase L1-like esterase
VRWARSAAVGTLVTALGLAGGLLATAQADGRQDAPRIFAVGHSWVVGTASGHQMGYVDMLVQGTGATRVDADHGGYTAPEVRSLVDAAPRCRASDLAIVQVGLNDVRMRGERGLPSFRHSLQSILQRLDGCPVIVVQEPGALDYAVKGQTLRGSDAVVRDYRTATAAVARLHPNVTLVRPLLRPSDYLDDGLHPDLSGNSRIALAIEATATWRAFAGSV